jgi:hypothetical protein
MPDQDVVDGKLAQRVVDGQDSSAGIAEDGGGALADEGGPDDFGSGEGGVRVLRVVSDRVLLCCALDETGKSEGRRPDDIPA